ncbi:hypothetical protein BOX15_Mlig027094g1, partial [Macrostomum lignano]
LLKMANADADEDSLSVIELLTCSICNCVVSDPRFLPCTHSVCLSCVDSIRNTIDWCTGSCAVCQHKLQLPFSSSQLGRDLAKSQLAKTVKINKKNRQPLCSAPDCQNAWKAVSALSSRAMCEQHLQAELDRLAAEVASLREPVAAALAPASRLSGICGRAAEKKQSLEATQREVESKFERLREQLEDAETLALKAVRIDIERSSSCSESAESIRAQLEQFQSMGESWSDLQTAGSQGAVQLVDETKRALRQLEHLDDSFATVSDRIESTAKKFVANLTLEVEKLSIELEKLVDQTVSCRRVLSLKKSKSVKLQSAPQFVTLLSDCKLMLDKNSCFTFIPFNDKIPAGAVAIRGSVLCYLFQTQYSEPTMHLFSFPGCDLILGGFFKIPYWHQDSALWSEDPDYIVKACFGVSSRSVFILAFSEAIASYYVGGKLLKRIQTNHSSMWSFCSKSEQLLVFSRNHGMSLYNSELQIMKLIPVSNLSCPSVLSMCPQFILADLGDGQVSRIEVSTRSVTILAQWKHLRAQLQGASVICEAKSKLCFVRVEKSIFVMNEQFDLVETLEIRNVRSGGFFKVRISNVDYLVLCSAAEKSVDFISINNYE